ncbi:uncharacterized protein A4U43_C02F16770 [Asparagus officinalis]|uniref:Uncharacterized protein n=1 Tax=Asparagus officinalis TaxID=4686 RepID=A0A5P1FJN1_ASPOF|nr:uncharacterized protein A4U43_C02F16770 [Asparagus officinalis]
MMNFDFSYLRAPVDYRNHYGHNRTHDPKVVRKDSVKVGFLKHDGGFSQEGLYGVNIIGKEPIPLDDEKQVDYELDDTNAYLTEHDDKGFDSDIGDSSFMPSMMNIILRSWVWQSLCNFLLAVDEGWWQQVGVCQGDAGRGKARAATIGEELDGGYVGTAEGLVGRVTTGGGLPGGEGVGRLRSDRSSRGRDSPARFQRSGGLAKAAIAAAQALLEAAQCQKEELELESAELVKERDFKAAELKAETIRLVVIRIQAAPVDPRVLREKAQKMLTMLGILG